MERNRLFISVIGVVIAVGIIYLIERLFLHPTELHASKEGVYAFEVVVLSVLIGKFVLGEVLRLYRGLNTQSPQDTEGLRGTDVRNILTTFAGSMFIYIVCSRLLK